MSDENKNQPKGLTEYKGRKILKVLHIVIGEDKSFYRCIMEDGSIELIPTKKGGE